MAGERPIQVYRPHHAKRTAPCWAGMPAGPARTRACLGPLLEASRSMRRWLHGSGGVARAYDPGVGTPLEVFAFVRSRRSTRQHLGQPGGTLVEGERLVGAFRQPTADPARTSRTAPHRRGDHGGGLRATLAAAQSRSRPRQARRPCRSRSCPGSAPPQSHQTYPGIESSPPHRQKGAVNHETATEAACRRVACLWKVFGNGGVLLQYRAE
jgi:hypothetical protein